MLCWEQLVRRTREGKGRQGKAQWHGRSFPKRRKWRATSLRVVEVVEVVEVMAPCWTFTNLYNIQQDIHALNHRNHRNHRPRCRSTRSKRTACWLTSFGWSLLKRSWARAATTENFSKGKEEIEKMFAGCWCYWCRTEKMFVTSGSSSPMGKWRTYTSIWNHQPASRRLTLLPFMKKETNHRGVTIWQLEKGKSFFQTQTGSWINVSSPQPWITMTITPIIPFNSPKQYRKSIGFDPSQKWVESKIIIIDHYPGRSPLSRFFSHTLFWLPIGSSATWIPKMWHPK